MLEAFLARGDEVGGVFCAPEKEGARPDALRAAAQEKGLKVHQFKSLRDPEAAQAMQEAGADIGIMAFVLQFAPQEFVTIPKHGTIQYHPSLLPKYRGPSSINWPIIKGDTETGLTIFRPSDGLDEGAVILQKKTPISPDDTLGTVYFDRLFPMGVQAMLEAADLVLAGKHTETVQDESQRELRRLVPLGRSENRLGQAHRSRLQPDPRMQSRAGGVDHVQRQEAADFRRPQDALPPFCRRAWKDRRSHRYHAAKLQGHGSGRHDRGAASQVRGRQEDNGGELAQSGGIAAGTLLGN